MILNWVDQINLVIAATGVLMMGLGLMLVITSHYLEPGTKRFFLAFFDTLLAYSLSSLITLILMTTPGHPLLSQIALFFESLLASLLVPLLTMFLVYSSTGKSKRGFLTRVVSLLWFVYFVLLVLAQFTDQIYFFTEEGIYQRGPYYPVLLIPIALSLALNLSALWHRRGLLTHRQRLAFSLYLLVPMIATLIQMRFYGILSIVLGTDLSAFIMLIFLISEQTDRYVQQAEENAQQRINIMVLQMRPHFIYNTMTSIYYLCEQDPKKAQQVIGDFTTYLRKNLGAVTGRELVPFESELEHARAYLAVEKARYEDLLFVEFDTPYTGFFIPPLTLQPLVENSVKYGVDPERNPLHIAVRTRLDEDIVEVCVEDDGPGFQPGSGNGLHIALSNIRDRLALMCGGTLDIYPREGGGTIVMICVPAKPR